MHEHYSSNEILIREEGTMEQGGNAFTRVRIKPADRFVKIYVGEVTDLLLLSGGRATILLMYIVSSGMLEYGTNCFSFNKHRKEEIMQNLGVKMGAVYKSLRQLKKVGLVEMDGLGNYLVNRNFIEYGKSSARKEIG